MAKNSLTKQQRIEVYCQAVFKGDSQSDAYRTAYPSSRKWKNETVHREASKFAQLPDVITRLAELRKQASDIAVVDEARVLKETSRIAFADLRELRDEFGQFKPVKDWPDDISAAVSGIEIDDEGRPTKVTLYNKNNALEKLFKHMGLYEKDNQQKAPILANLDKLPLAVKDKIAEKLHGLISSGGSELSGGTDSGSSERTTH